MLKKIKNIRISIVHLDIVSFVALIIGICGIVCGIKIEMNNSFLPFLFVLSILLTVLSAINLICTITSVIASKREGKKQIFMACCSKTITSNDELFKYTSYIVVMAIVILLITIFYNIIF